MAGSGGANGRDRPALDRNIDGPGGGLERPPSSHRNQTILNTTAPAGVTGEPNNLGLADLTVDHVGATSLIVGGIQSGWSLKL